MMPLAGEKLDYNLSTAILAANQVCMDQALEVLRRHDSGNCRTND